VSAPADLRAPALGPTGGAPVFQPAPPAPGVVPAPPLGVVAAGLAFRNPVVLASGTAGYGHELAEVVDFARLGAIATKAVSVAPRAGNPAPRVAEFPAACSTPSASPTRGWRPFGATTCRGWPRARTARACS
jgi:hypothetical protein